MLEETIRTGLTFDDVLLVPAESQTLPREVDTTVQLVAVLRVCAELHSDPLPLLAIAAIGWLLAFAPWVVRSSWIYLTPRMDGKDG